MDHTRKEQAGQGGPAAEPLGPLGTTAKSSSRSEWEAERDTPIDRAPAPGEGRSAARAERYHALSVARLWIALRMRKIDPDRLPGDVYRTHDCRYVRRARTVDVHYSQELASAHYTNLATCGSVWACPVCTQVIQQRRRLELAMLIDWAYANGFSPAMVTFTFPHRSFDTLADLKARQADAFKRLRSGRRWQAFKADFGFGGLVRSLEVTFGANGWHPHTHEIWLIRDLDGAQRARFENAIRERWQEVCIRAGLLDGDDRDQLHAFGLHSVDVRFQVSQSDYLAKQDASRAWGVDREVASATSKKGRRSGVHPHEFLVRRSRGDLSRYFEYIHAMKGSRQLYWSPGLKDAVGIVDIDDDQAAEVSGTPADLLGSLSASEWDVVRRQGQRARLLDLAETGDWGQVRAFLVALGVDPWA